MIISKLRNTSSIPELITIFIAINFIFQVSYKIGFLGTFGFWTITLFNPIEIMFGNVEILIIYILIFSYIIGTQNTSGILYGIACVTLFPFLSNVIISGEFNIPSYCIFGIFIGLLGLVLKKYAIDTANELTMLVLIFMIAPLLYGAIYGIRFQTSSLAEMEYKTEDKIEIRYILDKFSDSFITIDKDKTNIKIIKIENSKQIKIRK